MNFQQVQILPAQVWLQATGKQITTINYVFSHSLECLLERGKKTFSAVWIGQKFTPRFRYSLIWAVCFAKTLSPSFSTSAFRRSRLLILCFSQEIKRYFLFMLFFSKWGGQMWGDRHMSKPGVESLRFQSGLHSTQLGPFAHVV